MGARMRRALQGNAPRLKTERKLWAEGVDVVAGVDEVGRGAWAGPLTVGAVVAARQRRIYKVRDSKMLTIDERESLYARICSWARAFAVGHASVTECTDLGMADAQRLAARRAIAGLGLSVDHVVVDGTWDFLNDRSRAVSHSAPHSPQAVDGAGVDGRDVRHARDEGEILKREGRIEVRPIPVTKMIRGDAKCLSIAAASIIAKVTRDRLMVAAAERYPGYWFASNKGYPCPRHVASLAEWGPTAIHRRRWVFMDDLRWTGVPRITTALSDTQLRLFDPASMSEEASLPEAQLRPDRGAHGGRDRHRGCGGSLWPPWDSPLPSCGQPHLGLA